MDPFLSCVPIKGYQLEKAPIMQNTKVRFEQIFASVFPLT